MKVFYLFYIFYIIGIEIACAIVGLTTVRKSWPPWYKLLVAMCCVTVVTEITGLVMYKHLYPLYNIWGPAEAFVAIYILFRETTMQWSRRLLMSLLIVLPVGVTIIFLFPPGISQANRYADTTETLTEVIAACAVLIDVLHDMSGASLYRSPKFWFAIGMLFSSCMMTLLMAVREVIDKDALWPYYFIPFFLTANTFMYGGIMRCFVLLKKKKPVSL